jgi:hypothetical protein
MEVSGSLSRNQENLFGAGRYGAGGSDLRHFRLIAMRICFRGNDSILKNKKTIARKLRFYNS